MCSAAGSEGQRSPQMRSRPALVWGTGELSGEQGRGELREVGDGDLSVERECGGRGSRKDNGRWGQV